jgi:hypothetical protein
MHSLAFLSQWATKALLFGMIGFVAVWFLRRSGAEAQHAVWRAVLAAMLMLPLLTMILPPLTVNPPWMVADKVTPWSDLESGHTCRPPGAHNSGCRRTDIVSPGFLAPTASDTGLKFLTITVAL